MRKRLVIKSNPVCVVQDGGAVERRGERGGVVEIEWMDLDGVAEEMLAVRRIGERSNALTLCKKTRCDVLA